MPYRDFPPDAREMWDVLAKALMIRSGGSVSVGVDEARAAGDTQAEIELRPDGTIEFRVERQ